VRYLEMLVRGASAFAAHPEVTTPLLKLVAEMVLQRGQRINFGNYSPNGVLLFRFASQAVVAYGSRMVDAPVPAGAEPYAAKYKTVAVCASILARALDGGYANFGVFELYSDPALRDAVTMLLRLLLSVPQEDLMKYPKLANLYMLSIEILHRNHIDLIAALPQPVFARLVRSLVDGLDCVDNDVAMRASSAMDHLATHFVKNWPKDTPTAQGLKLLVAADQGIFAVLMRQLFKVLVLDEAPASAQSVGHMTALTLVRPLLPVILAAECVQPGALEVFKAELIASQPASLQPRALEEFNRFASGLTRSLDMLNRDRFITRLHTFRTSYKEFARG